MMYINSKIFSLFVVIAMILYNCQNIKSDNKKKSESLHPLGIGMVWKYKNIIYPKNDTISNIYTRKITEKYKNYFILKGFMGTNLVKYKNDKFILYGSINNSDTVLYDNPLVLGFMDGRTGYIDSDSLKMKKKLITRDSLNVSIIPKYKVLGEIDTVYKNTYKASCPNLSYICEYYSKKYGLVKLESFFEGNIHKIAQKIVLKNKTKN